MEQQGGAKDVEKVGAMANAIGVIKMDAQCLILMHWIAMTSISMVFDWDNSGLIEIINIQQNLSLTYRNNQSFSYCHY